MTPDPGSSASLTPGIRCLFDPWIRDPGRGKKSGSRSGMNNLDHISECFRNNLFFLVKILKFFDADPGSGMGKIQIRNKQSGSATLLLWKFMNCCPRQCSGFGPGSGRIRDSNSRISGSGFTDLEHWYMYNRRKIITERINAILRDCHKSS